MKQNIMNKWVKALRSGDYKQGFSVLAKRKPHQKTEFCCLGVLCDLAVKDGVDIDVNKSDSVVFFYNNMTGTLPNIIIKWAGMNTSVGKLPFDHKNVGLDYYYNLIDYNDKTNIGFEGIATIIEKNWKLL